MKNLLSILFIVQCSIVFSQADTLNRINTDGKKHGYWIIYGKERKNSGFADTAIVEEGRYDTGLKTGIWKTYYRNGNKKSEVEYKKNRPNGKFTTYYENGNIEEEGFWKGTYYLGKFTRYFSDGCKAQEKDFGTNGKSIWYVYYFPGEPCERKEMEYNLDSSGMYLEYNINGDTLRFLDHQPPLYFPGHGDIPAKGKVEIQYKSDTTKIKGKDFDPNGYNKVYNSNKQISEDGQYQDGKLLHGKKYIYDKNGLLDKIEIYKNGKYAGDAQIDD